MTMIFYGKCFMKLFTVPLRNYRNQSFMSHPLLSMLFLSDEREITGLSFSLIGV